MMENEIVIIKRRDVEESVIDKMWNIHKRSNNNGLLMIAVYINCYTITLVIKEKLLKEKLNIKVIFFETRKEVMKDSSYVLWRHKSTQILISFILQGDHKKLDNFEIIAKGFKSNFKRQISEALHIKEKADLNIQKDAYRLSLYS